MESASGFSSMIAFSAGPRLSISGLSISSMRARYFSASDRAVNLPDFIPFCSSGIVISSSSNGLTSAGCGTGGGAGGAGGGARGGRAGEVARGSPGGVNRRQGGGGSAQQRSLEKRAAV